MKGSCMLDFIPDRDPNRQCWMLFKVAPLNRAIDLQKGLLYMNSVDFFSNLEDEEHVALRRDEIEKTYAVFKSCRKGNIVHELAVQTSSGELVLKEGTEITLDLPNPKNIMLYCFGSLADGPDHLIPGEKNGEVWLDDKFKNFGDHVLLITNPLEFSKRLNAAIKSHNHLYSSEFFEGGYGQVDYVDMSDHVGQIGLFRKDLKYAWQREFRICFGAEKEALNDNGALELRIGDISDITNIVPIEQFVGYPFQLKRRAYKKINGEYVLI